MTADPALDELVRANTCTACGQRRISKRPPLWDWCAMRDAWAQLKATVRSALSTPAHAQPDLALDTPWTRFEPSNSDTWPPSDTWILLALGPVLLTIAMLVEESEHWVPIGPSRNSPLHLLDLSPYYWARIPPLPPEAT